MEHAPLNGTATQRKWRRDFRSWGERRFILWFGVVGFGGWMFVAMTAFDFIYHHRIDYVFLALNLVLWPIAGYRFGQSMWSRWGINTVNCPRCNRLMPTIRKPKSMSQAMWGGWTCEQCGCVMDRWGHETMPS
jgi:hypothetical protein